MDHIWVALYRGTSTVSRAIRWQTRSPYSHAALLLQDNSVIEAWTQGGVRHNPSLGFMHTPGTVVDLFSVRELSAAQETAVVAFHEKQIGKGYDFASVARFVSREKGDDPARWFCSELVFAAFLYAGRALLQRVSACEVSPGLLSYAPALWYRGTVCTGS